MVQVSTRQATRLTAGTLLCACAIACVVSDVGGEEHGVDETRPQCGHWSILRSCELLGVPIEMKTLLQMLPAKSGGHSMLEMAQTLRVIGLKAVGKRENLEELARSSFPVIVHLIEPDHFVTISKIEDQHIYVFDGAGRSGALAAAEFKEMWDGSALIVQRGSDDEPLPIFLNRVKGEGSCIQFERLIIDKGEVPWDGKPLIYEFPFRNIGASPLVIEKIQTSCGCLSSERPDKPVPPGGKGVIRLRYSLKEGAGPFKHEAVVRTNDLRIRSVKLTAAGNTDTTVRVMPRHLHFGKVVGGETATALCFVHYSGDIPLEIQGISCKNEQVRITHSVLTEEITKLIWPGARPCKGCVLNPSNTHVVKATVTAEYSDCGEPIEGIAVIRTNIKGFEGIAIPVLAEIVSLVRLYPDVLAFVGIDPDVDITRTVTVVSSDGRPFRIVAVSTKDSRMKCFISQSSPRRAALSFSTKGAVALGFTGKELEITLEIEVGEAEKQITLRLPVYAHDL